VLLNLTDHRSKNIYHKNITINVTKSLLELYDVIPTKRLPIPNPIPYLMLLDFCARMGTDTLGLFASHTLTCCNTLQSIVLYYVYYKMEHVGALRCEQTFCDEL